MSSALTPSRIALLSLVACLQLGVLAKIVVDRVVLLRTGREIALPIIPVDPRDLFRGDYVTLGYPISQIALADVGPRGDFKDLREGRRVYVVIRQGSDQNWKPVAVTASPPKPVSGGDAMVQGRVAGIWKTPEGGDDRVLIHYGIERYFVPEGTGQKLEAKVRDHDMQALLAVDADGTAAIKGLIIGGERHEDPPLF